jgi:predicted ATPase
MPIHKLHIAGYRSIRDMRLSLGRVNVVTGPNGVGKSNLYRAIHLMAKAACGELAESIALEGGMPSVLCALPRRDRKPVRMRMGVELDEFSYELVCGFPIPGATMFFLDPAVKEEFVWLGSQRKPTTTLLSRKNTMVTVRDGEGRSVEYPMELEHNESVLSQVKEPHRYPELSVLRGVGSSRCWESR